MAGHDGYSHLAVLLVALLFFLCFIPQSCNGARATPHDPTTSTSIEFIRASCRGTQYPSLCFTSLSTHASTVHTSRTQLADAALSVSLNSAKEVSAALKRMSTPPPAGKQVKKDCMEEVADSVDELRESLSAMEHLEGKKGRGFRLNSIQTWVSAALTNEDTCMDGLRGGGDHEDMTTSVRGRVLEVAMMTSNALDLVHGLVSSLRSSP